MHKADALVPGHCSSPIHEHLEQAYIKVYGKGDCKVKTKDCVPFSVQEDFIFMKVE